RDALGDLETHGRVEALVVGGVDLDLVHVHPHQRTLRVRRGPELARDGVGALCNRVAREAGRGAAGQAGHEAAAMGLLRAVAHRPLPAPALPGARTPWRLW